MISTKEGHIYRIEQFQVQSWWASFNFLMLVVHVHDQLQKDRWRSDLYKSSSFQLQVIMNPWLKLIAEHVSGDHVMASALFA